MKKLDNKAKEKEDEQQVFDAPVTTILLVIVAVNYLQ